ncbi:hypothetical protein SLNSH_04720 [Alsobacter soli]|uniref:Tyrosine-protein kinase G-rich domain-containing protein n=1 Tax=Alsobacter soli TaxID=2109933 RepID=A0A2T1HWQ7_9HYPH|nr:exopolysaccharide transport family protein [Alsobacter soli]PSC06112.1 hypothetical protein SLNSH_04720 [Alsobacter soli]
MSIVTHHRWEEAPGARDADRASPRGWAAEAITIDLRGGGRMLARRKGWLLAPLALCTLASLAGAMLVKPRFASTVQLLADPRELQVVRPDATLRVQAAELTSNDAETALGVLRSASILGKVVAREGLDRDPEFIGAKPPSEPALAALTALEKRVAVKRAEKSFVVDVSVWTLGAEKSARIANAISAVYLQEEAAGKVEAAKRAGQALASRIGELSVRVQEAERAVAEYRSRNELVGANGSLVAEQQIAEISKQLVTARARTADARARFDQVQQLRRQPLAMGDLPDAAGSPVITQLRARYADASRIDADLATRLGPRHPDVIAAAAQVKDVRRQLDGELARLARSAEADYERARSAEESLGRTLDRLKAVSNDNGEAMVRLRELERQAEASRAIYATFLQRAKEISEQQGIDTSNSRVISPAIPAQAPTGLSRSMILAGGLMGGLVLGLALVLTREITDGTLYGKAQFATASGLPVLGVLEQERRRSRSRPALRAHVSEHPASSFAAVAYRILDLTGPRQSRMAARTVVFLSVEPTFQRTQIAFNLAVAAARDEGRVLFVDADQANGFTRLLSERPDQGLADVLSRRCSLDRAVVVDEATEIGILAAGEGGIGRPSADLLAAALMAPARGFDRVIIDGPCPGLDPAALSVAASCDDVILVVAAGATRRENLQDALELLGPVRAKVRGLVVA